MLRRLRTTNKGLLAGATVVVLILVASVVVPAVSPFDPMSGDSPPLLPPGSEHWFGTDNLGRDIFTRTFAAARLDFFIAFIGLSFPLVVGTLIGAFLGVAQKSKVAGFLGVLIEGVNAFPFIVLALGIVAVFGSGVFGVVMAIWLSRWSRYARLATPKSRVVANSEYVKAARLLGYGSGRVMVRHVLPNVYGESFAYALSDYIIMILIISSLSFLGAGVQPPTPEWGAMIADGRLFLTSSWWISIMPGVVLTITALGVLSVASHVTRRLSIG